jgi:hypothetical protein
MEQSLKSNLPNHRPRCRNIGTVTYPRERFNHCVKRTLSRLWQQKWEGRKSGIDGMAQASLAAEELTRIPVGKNWL